MMNFFSRVCLCGSQAKIPRQLNAGFIFLNFLIWSLITSTCYQSLCVEHCNWASAIHQWKTLKIFMKTFSNNTPWVSNRRTSTLTKFVFLQGIYMFHVVIEPGKKLVNLTTVETVLNYKRRYLRKGKISVKLLDAELRNELMVFSIINLSLFFEEF